MELADMANFNTNIVRISPLLATGWYHEKLKSCLSRCNVWQNSLSTTGMTTGIEQRYKILNMSSDYWW